METKKIFKFEVGEKFPEELMNDKDAPFMCFWMNGSINIVIKDCREEKEAELFKNSEIKFSVCRVKDVVFFVSRIVALGLEFDVPFNINLAGLSDEELEKGISSVYLFFLDNNRIIKCMRCMILIPQISKRLTDIFLREKEDLNLSNEEYSKLLSEIYRRYKEPSELLEREVLRIIWRMDSEKMNKGAD